MDFGGGGDVFEHDHHGRLVAALGYAEQGAHAELLHAVAVEDFDVEAEVVGDLLGLLRDDGGRHQVGGFVAEVAREVLGFG